LKGPQDADGGHFSISIYSRRMYPAGDLEGPRHAHTRRGLFILIRLKLLREVALPSRTASARSPTAFTSALAFRSD
jgi:hypothetical protein